jgi:hypothetical protein
MEAGKMVATITQSFGVWYCKLKEYIMEVRVNGMSRIPKLQHYCRRLWLAHEGSRTYSKMP